jgi:hypothetical protein
MKILLILGLTASTAFLFSACDEDHDQYPHHDRSSTTTTTTEQTTVQQGVPASTTTVRPY